MSDNKENKRTCFKCCSSPSVDGVKLFRVLKPGLWNLVRCEQWAKFLFPEQNVSSVEFQMKLFNEHRMVCARHFKDEDFKDSSRKYLLRTAVPCDAQTELPVFQRQIDQPGPSSMVPQPRDLTNKSTVDQPLPPTTTTTIRDAHIELPVFEINQPGPSSMVAPVPPLRDLTNKSTVDQQLPSTTTTTKRDAHTELPIIEKNQPGPSSMVPPLRDLTNKSTVDQPLPSKTTTTKRDAHTAVPVYELDQPGPATMVPPLRGLTNKPTEDQSLPSTSTNTKSKPAASQKEKILRAKCKKYLQKICQLHKRIKKLNNNAILNTLANEKNVKKLCDKITPTFALLLQGQIRNFNRKIKGRRWSKEEKIIALRIYKRSPTCYRLLRRIFLLPSPTTLKTLLNKVPFGVGCNESVFEVLKKFVKTQAPMTNEFLLMWDEMSLKKHLHYDPKGDIIEGYQDHGSQGRSELIAGYALVFMIGGIRLRVKQPIAHYFSSGFATADRLAALTKEVLNQCSEAGVNIAATVCDMDGVNRRALSTLGASTEHPYITVGGKEIVTMFDTPHLLKCFRNLFMKYDIECTSNIHSTDKVGKGVAKWSHIKQFFEMDNANPNFVFAPCLKKDHLNPNNKQKMKVNLAAQVLSHSVAAGMFAKISEGSLTAEAAVTANVISNMDKLFDSLNSDSSDLRRGKPHATNLTATSPHNDLFPEMKIFFSTLKFVGISRKPPSQEGWIWSINAVQRLWHNLTQKHKIKIIATRRLQQDPLENLFGCIRGNCGSNTNPTCGQFVAGLKTAILSSLSHLGTSGNCENDNNVIINNFDTLLSVSQATPSHEVECEFTFSVSSTLSFEVDEAMNENTADVQACAYVCGYLIKQLPVKECANCKQIFLSDCINEYHNFIECREYRDFENSLNYVTKDMIACVELCASIINDFLKENSHKNNLKKTIVKDLKNNVNFDFMEACSSHKDSNINVITQSVFFICIKRFCISKNRSLAEESSASALKRKMDIILHK